MRLIIGISGASGVVMGYALLKALRAAEVETHLVVTEAAERTLACETSLKAEDLKGLADAFYDPRDMAARIASGSFVTDGMIVVPCSMKSVAGIANGFSDNLLLRAADVCVKEKRPLVLAARETPLSPIHLRNLQTLAGLPKVWIMPPMMTWYMKPQSIEEMEHHLVAKMLAPFGIEVPAFHWGE